MWFEVYFVSRFYPERGEIFSGRYKTREEAEQYVRFANQYSHCHGCRFWVSETI